MNAFAHSLPVLHARFAAKDRVVIDGTAYSPEESNHAGHILRRIDGGLCESFSHERIDALYRDGLLSVEHQHFSKTAAAQRLLDAELLSELPEKQLAIVEWRRHFCEGFLAEEADGTATRSDESIRQAIGRIQAKFATLEAERTIDSRRCGAELALKLPPKPSTLRLWLRRFDVRGAIALSDSYGRGGNRAERLDAGVRQLLAECIDEFASDRRPSRKLIHRHLRVRIAELNVVRVEQGKVPVAVPSYSTLAREIQRLNELRQHAGRHGVERARNKFAVVREGIAVRRPLERVELDDWRIPLQTFLKKVGIWDELPDELRDQITNRYWLSVAIDCATRCILAARVISTPSAAESAATVRHILSDKSQLAAEAGCTETWSTFGVPAAIVTDGGSAFCNHEFRATLLDLGIHHLVPPSGLPFLRGTVERVFRTLHEQLIAQFSGRTFRDPVDRGDYQSEVKVSLDVDQLARLIVRYIVDVYHNSPHKGLAGDTPLAKWRELTKVYGVRLPPPLNLQRRIFGLKLWRHITNYGVTCLGLNYQSAELQRLRRTVGGKVLVRLDPHDLGSVTITADNVRLDVPCTDPSAEGQSLARRVQVEAYLRRQHLANSQAAEHHVLGALRDIEETARAVAERNGIASPVLTQQAFERLEKAITSDYRHDQGYPPIAIEPPEGNWYVPGESDEIALPPPPPSDEPTPNVDDDDDGDDTIFFEE